MFLLSTLLGEDVNFVQFSTSTGSGSVDNVRPSKPTNSSRTTESQHFHGVETPKIVPMLLVLLMSRSFWDVTYQKQWLLVNMGPQGSDLHIEFLYTLLETNMAPESRPLETEIPIGPSFLGAMLVSGRSSWISSGRWRTTQVIISLCVCLPLSGRSTPKRCAKSFLRGYGRKRPEGFIIPHHRQMSRCKWSSQVSKIHAAIFVRKIFECTPYMVFIMNMDLFHLNFFECTHECMGNS